MNLKHLFYFWKVAKLGGVIRASEAIHISPQTLSGQIKLLEDRVGTALFSKRGRGLELTEAGHVALKYADDLFALSSELDQVLRHYPKGRPTALRVGVSNAVPKSLAYRLLHPVVTDVADEPVRLICREWETEKLLADLALHRLDLVIADTPVPDNIEVLAYSHPLGESGLSFLAHHSLAQEIKKQKWSFPDCLNHLPVLMPGEESSMRRVINQWLSRYQIKVRIVGEFDDLALMSAFGREKVGVFPIPTVLIEEYCDIHNNSREHPSETKKVKILTPSQQNSPLVCIGELMDARVAYYALTVERRITHPSVISIIEKAGDCLSINTSKASKVLSKSKRKLSASIVKSI